VPPQRAPARRTAKPRATARPPPCTPIDPETLEPCPDPNAPVTAGAPPPRPAPAANIAIVTAHIRGVDPRGPNLMPVVTSAERTADMADIAEANINAYAKWHGYRMNVLRDPVDRDRPLAWSRYLAVLEMFEQGFEWVLYMDADALVANMSVTIEERVQPPPEAGCPEAPEVLVATLPAHVGGAAAAAAEETLSGGVMLFKNTPGVRELIYRLYQYRPALEDEYQDTAALMDLVTSGEYPFVCTLRGPHASWLQAYPHHTRTPGTYRPGDWIVHVAGGCAPWCRLVAQLTHVCAMHPDLAECRHAMTLHGWAPMPPFDAPHDVPTKSEKGHLSGWQRHP